MSTLGLSKFQDIYDSYSATQQVFLALLQLAVVSPAWAVMAAYSNVATFALAQQHFC